VKNQIRVTKFFFKDDSKSDSLWLVILHLSSILPLLVVPLLIWSWKKKQSSEIDQQGRKVLNFQITMMLLLFLGGFLISLLTAMLPAIGKAIDQAGMNMGLFELIIFCIPSPMALIGLFCLYAGISNAIRSLTEKPVHYPLSIPFIK